VVRIRIRIWEAENHPDPGHWKETDPDPGGLKAYGSYEPGSTTLVFRVMRGFLNAASSPLKKASAISKGFQEYKVLLFIEARKNFQLIFSTIRHFKKFKTVGAHEKSDITDLILKSLKKYIRPRES
jgi:hypothetical protein